MHAGILQRSEYLGRDHVARDADDEQFAAAGVENQFRRHARIAAAEDGRVWPLAPGERGEHFLLNGWEPRFALEEALVAGDQTLERFVGGVRGRWMCTHWLIDRGATGRGSCRPHG